MHPLHTAIAVGPLAIYLLALGMLNLARRPFLTTGIRDFYALGIGMSGFFVVGPLSLFMPEPAALVFGPYIWLLLVAFYALCLTLFVLLARPRLVVYNMTFDQLRPLLASMIRRVELEHCWAGESLALPGWGVQLQLEKFPLARNVSLVATAAEQSYLGWRRLEKELAAEIRSVEAPPNPLGLVLIGGSTLAFSATLIWLVAERSLVAERIVDMLRL